MAVPPLTAGQFVEAAGIRTFYLQAGQGPAVLLIHGAGPGACAQVVWKPTIHPLAAAGYAVYAYDQPGFGHSAIPPDHGMEFRVAHARALIAALGLERVHLIGSSMGAYIAARLALEEPRCGRLVLVASSTLAPEGSEAAAARARAHAQELRDFTPSREAIRTLTLGTIFTQALVTDELVEERLAMSLGPRQEAHARRRQAGRPRPLRDELARLATPTLIVWGRNDAGAAVERASLLQALIPGSELHVFDRAGHWVQWDQAARFVTLVAGFLREHA
jgi:pimeloyl-ACP methyl ester carboxylesterase